MKKLLVDKYGQKNNEGLKTHTDKINDTHTDAHRKHDTNLPKKLKIRLLLLVKKFRTFSKIDASVTICVMPYMARDHKTVCIKKELIICLKCF